MMALSLIGLVLAARADDYEPIRATVAKLQPNAVIEKIEPSPLKGLISVYVKDFDPIYMTPDGRSFIVGTMLQVTDAGKVVDVGGERKAGERAALLRKAPQADMITYRPKGDAKAAVYVFTDVDCGYCRQLHSHVQEYTAAGIEIRYLAYPRGGLESDTFGKMESIWCSKDRAASLTKAKAGGEIPAANCSNPVAGQYRLGKALGVQGTPAVFTADGRQIGGYLPTEAMKKALGI